MTLLPLLLLSSHQLGKGLVELDDGNLCSGRYIVPLAAATKYSVFPVLSSWFSLSARWKASN